MPRFHHQTLNSAAEGFTLVGTGHTGSAWECQCMVACREQRGYGKVEHKNTGHSVILHRHAGNCPVTVKLSSSTLYCNLLLLKAAFVRTHLDVIRTLEHRHLSFCFNLLVFAGQGRLRIQLGKKKNPFATGSSSQKCSSIVSVRWGSIVESF